MLDAKTVLILSNLDGGSERMSQGGKVWVFHVLILSNLDGGSESQKEESIQSPKFCLNPI